MSRALTESGRAKWQGIINKQRGSGLPVAAFCRRERVPASSFFAWKRRLAAEAVDGGPAFVEVTSQGKWVTSAAQQSGPARPVEPLEVLIASDRRIVIRPGFDAQALREVVRVLEELP